MDDVLTPSSAILEFDKLEHAQTFGANNSVTTYIERKAVLAWVNEHFIAKEVVVPKATAA